MEKEMEKEKKYNKYGHIIFEGEYLNGKRNGKGKEYYLNGQLKCLFLCYFYYIIFI